MRQVFLLLSCLGFLALPVSADAQQAPVAINTSAPIAISTVLINPSVKLAPLATQLGETLQTLVGVASTKPPSAPNKDEEDTGQVTDTYATILLNSLTRVFEALKKDSAAFEANTTAIPDMAAWFQDQNTDPRRQALWHNIANDLLITIGVPLLTGLATMLFLWPLRNRLLRFTPQSIAGQITLLFSLLALRLVAVVVFLGASLLLLDQNETHNLPRFVILNVIYAFSVAYTVRQVLRTIFAPNAGHLRLFSFTTPQAVYACRWFSAFAILIVYGYFIIDVAGALRIPGSAVILFQNVMALVLMMMAITVIVQIRDRVATMLLGKTPEQQTFGQSLRSGFAAHWHQLAIAYMVIGFLITVLGIQNGLGLMLRGTILTLVILVLTRFSFLIIDQWKASTVTNGGLAHRQILAFLLRPLIWIVAIAAIAATWGLHVGSVIATSFGQHLTGAFVSVVVTLLILTLLYEMINAAIDGYLERRDKDTKTPVASARARTLLPMVRNTIFILFSVIIVLTLLSAVGVNIAPLLAGAGVLGVAIGFGSQSLVKDFLTGLFIVVEDVIAVGDIVKIGNFGGVVEALSIRTIRLRDSDGAMHILPFSEVSKISNMSKGFGFALVDIAVSYDSNLDHVMNVIRDVGNKLQEDPVYKRVIVEAIEVLGVENLGDSSITIRARIRTRPGKQWDVRRLLLQRIKERFDEEKIVIPYPTVTHITKTLDE